MDDSLKILNFEDLLKVSWQNDEPLPSSARGYLTPRKTPSEQTEDEINQIENNTEEILTFFPITSRLLTTLYIKQEYEWHFETIFPLESFDFNVFYKTVWEYPTMNDHLKWLNIGEIIAVQKIKRIVTGNQLITLQKLTAKPSLDLFTQITANWQPFLQDDFETTIYIMKAELGHEIKFQIIFNSHLQYYFPYFRGHVTYQQMEDHFKQHVRWQTVIHCGYQDASSPSSSSSSSLSPISLVSSLVSKSMNYLVANKLFYGLQHFFCIKMLEEIKLK